MPETGTGGWQVASGPDEDGDDWVVACARHDVSSRVEVPEGEQVVIALADADRDPGDGRP